MSDLLKHTVTGRELLELLADFPADCLPSGVMESHGDLMLHGEPITNDGEYSVWSCNGQQPLHKFDSDWSVEKLEPTNETP